MTTRLMPASTSAFAHGGVWPKCAHGSRDTYAVAPRARAPAFASATVSACGRPPVGGGAAGDDFAASDDNASDGGIGRGESERGFGERDGFLHQAGVAFEVGAGGGHTSSVPLPLLSRVSAGEEARRGRCDGCAQRACRAGEGAARATSDREVITLHSQVIASKVGGARSTLTRVARLSRRQERQARQPFNFASAATGVRASAASRSPRKNAGEKRGSDRQARALFLRWLQIVGGRPSPFLSRAREDALAGACLRRRIRSSSSCMNSSMSLNDR